MADIFHELPIRAARDRVFRGDQLARRSRHVVDEDERRPRRSRRDLRPGFRARLSMAGARHHVHIWTRRSSWSSRGQTTTGTARASGFELENRNDRTWLKFHHTGWPTPERALSQLEHLLGVVSARAAAIAGARRTGALRGSSGCVRSDSSSLVESQSPQAQAFWRCVLPSAFCLLPLICPTRRSQNRRRTPGSTALSSKVPSVPPSGSWRGRRCSRTSSPACRASSITSWSATSSATPATPPSASAGRSSSSSSSSWRRCSPARRCWWRDSSAPAKATR